MEKKKVFRIGEAIPLKVFEPKPVYGVLRPVYKSMEAIGYCDNCGKEFFDKTWFLHEEKELCKKCYAPYSADGNDLHKKQGTTSKNAYNQPELWFWNVIINREKVYSGTWKEVLQFRKTHEKAIFRPAYMV